MMLAVIFGCYTVAIIGAVVYALMMAGEGYDGCSNADALMQEVMAAV